MIHDDVLSRVMFWVGAMFVFTPLLVVTVVVLSVRHGRKKRQAAAAGPEPTH